MSDTDKTRAHHEKEIAERITALLSRIDGGSDAK